LKSGRDWDFQAKKAVMPGLTGKNGRERGIGEPYCGPSLIEFANIFFPPTWKGVIPKRAALRKHA